ncbi:hypothetical protein PV761_12015 [Arthrobacter sp. CC3]|uniref:hypothetical protein n=1 Tax=Arthrobacter sp. CC3 TaxID=3029185 RepID=UPI0032651079
MSGRHNTSSPGSPHGFRRGLVLFQRLIRRGIAVSVALVLAVLLGAPAASASWSATGKGSTTAAAATLAPPTNVTVPSSSNSNVSVSWTGQAGTPAATGYYVSRITGSTSVLACGSSPAAPITGTSCTDSSVPEGTHKYVVTAVHRSWRATSAASGIVTVSSINDLRFGVQPAASVVAGSALPAFTVELRTAFGWPLWKSDVPVTIGLASNPGGGTLAGTLTAYTNGWGEATFTGLAITKAGAYTLIASSPGYAGVVSSTFTVTAAAATQLAVSGPASGTASATATVGPFTVQRQDAYGNPVTTGSTEVTFASSSTGTKVFAATAGGAPLTKVTIPAGAASASFFYGDTKAAAPVITAAATGLGQATAQVSITPAAAAKLVFGQQPTNTAKGQRITPVTVLVVDQFNNLQTTSVAPVTMDKTVKQGNLGGTVVQSAVGGVATFSDLTINPAGAHTLIATSPGLGTVTSTEFTSGG